MEKQRAILVDLDWTLCQLKPHEDCHNHTWKELVIEDMREELEKEWYMLDVDIIILTWRKERFREITEKWFIENQIWYDRIIMQQGSIWEKNHIYKEKVILELIEEYDILMMYDDNHIVWDICRNLKIPFTQR